MLIHNIEQPHSSELRNCLIKWLLSCFICGFLLAFQYPPDKIMILFVGLGFSYFFFFAVKAQFPYVLMRLMGIAGGGSLGAILAGLI